MLIDKYMPDYDVRDYHETVVTADSKRVYRMLRSMDIYRSFVIRSLFAIRSIPARLFRFGKTQPEKSSGQPFVDFALSLGWKILEETPGQEIVVGSVTQPWKADVKFQGITGSELAAFAEPDYAKIVWSMAAIPEDHGRCRVVLETRVAATDDPARRKFKKYWFVFGPFIGLIRRIILRMLKRELRTTPRQTLPI